MSSITDFVAELVRAANEVEKLSAAERGSLLDRAYRTVRDARDEIGVEQDSLDRDPAIDFLTMSRSVPMFSDEEIKSALLEAAGVIRHLKIILDARGDVTSGGATP